MNNEENSNKIEDLKMNNEENSNKEENNNKEDLEKNEMSKEENSNKMDGLGKDSIAASCFNLDFHADIGEQIYSRGVCNTLAKMALSVRKSCNSRFGIHFKTFLKYRADSLNNYSNYLAKFKNCCKPIPLPESLCNLSMAVSRAADAVSKAQYHFNELCKLDNALLALYSASKRAAKDLISEDDFKKDSGELENKQQATKDLISEDDLKKDSGELENKQ